MTPSPLSPNSHHIHHHSLHHHHTTPPAHPTPLLPHDPTEDVEALDPDHRMANTDVKYLRTAFGKELKFRPDGIDIIAKDSKVFMTLNDDGVMYLNAEKSISMTAVENIVMKAPKVNIEATEEILLKTPSSTVDMTSHIELTGAEVRTN